MATATVQLNTRVPESVHNELQALAQRSGTTISQEVKLALLAHLKATRRR